MPKKCEIKPYIDELPITQKHKEFINNKHNIIFDELKNSKKFKLFNSKLYAFKEKYVESLNEVARVNNKYGNKVVAIINTPTANRVIQINAISLANDYNPEAEEEFKSQDFYKDDQILKEQEVKNLSVEELYEKSFEVSDDTIEEKIKQCE